MKSYRLLIGDPGRTNDPFGEIGLEATYPEKKIYVRFAKQFKNVPYEIVANHFGKMKKLFNPHTIILEKNFDYPNVSRAFAHLPITYVTTSSGLSESTRVKGLSVDKPYMIGWLKVEKKKHNIQYPPKCSRDMQELINQDNEMSGILFPSGHTTYKRVRNRHDDLSMANLIGCNAIRMWWENQ